MPATNGPADAVVDFSAHSVVVADVDPAEVRAHLPHSNPGAAMNAAFLIWLAERLGTRPGVFDMVTVAFGTGGPAPDLVPRDDLMEHPRVALERRFRSDLRVFSDRRDRGLVSLGRGLAGRLEVGVEVDGVHRGKGLGRELARAALCLVPEGEPLFAQVSPGNIASVRAFIAAGYRPICAEVQFLRGPAT